MNSTAHGNIILCFQHPADRLGHPAKFRSVAKRVSVVGNIPVNEDDPTNMNSHKTWDGFGFQIVYIERLRAHLFCIVVAGIECLFMPIGTVLGVYHCGFAVTFR